MKIQDLLQMDAMFDFGTPTRHNGISLWSLDQIERIVHHPLLCSEEIELLAMVARRIRDERDYRISDSILAAMEIIAGKVQGVN